MIAGETARKRIGAVRDFCRVLDQLLFPLAAPALSGEGLAALGRPVLFHPTKPSGASFGTEVDGRC